MNELQHPVVCRLLAVCSASDGEEVRVADEAYEIDLVAEELIAVSGDLPRFVQELTGGRRIHNSTAYRWALRGVCGRRLPTVRVARRLYTSRDAFSWWASKRSLRRARLRSSPGPSTLRTRCVGRASESKSPPECELTSGECSAHQTLRGCSGCRSTLGRRTSSSGQGISGCSTSRFPREAFGPRDTAGLP